MINVIIPILSSLVVLTGEVAINYDEYRDSVNKVVCEAWDDCKALSEAIVYESRGESDRGKKAVADVVICRYNDSRWPDSITDVLYQKKQFSYVQDMYRQAAPKEKDFDTARHIAIQTLLKLREPVVDACWYHANYVKPSWAKKLTMVAQIGNHKFYKDK